MTGSNTSSVETAERVLHLHPQPGAPQVLRLQCSAVLRASEEGDPVYKVCGNRTDYKWWWQRVMETAAVGPEGYGDGGNGNVWWRGNSHAAQLSRALRTAAVTVLSWPDGSPPFGASGPHSTGGIICYYENEGVSSHAMVSADTIHPIAGGAAMLPCCHAASSREIFNTARPVYPFERLYWRVLV